MAWSKWWLGLAVASAMAVAVPVAAQQDAAQEGDDAATEDGAGNGDAMYEYLVAEIAAQRGDVDGALAIYQRLARELGDPGIARRAVETAIRARQFGPALDSATLLLELDPESSLAREIMASLLGNEGDLGKARDLVAGILEKTQNRAPILMQMSHLFAKFSDKREVLKATLAVTKPYGDEAEAHYAVGMAALVAGDVDLAHRESDEALERRPGWEEGAILKAQVVRRNAPAKVAPFYQDFIAAHPDSPEVRMQLGRELASERKLVEAREEFREAQKLLPKDAQPVYAEGLLSLQLDEFGAAQTAFSKALKLGYREPAAIYLGLGQAAEGLKRYDEAISWYQKVDTGDWVRAQLKIATLIARQQGLEAGRDYLRKIDPKSPEDSIQMIQVEAQLLRDAKEWRETYDMLSKAVGKYPDSYELLYDRAMAAERIDRLDVLESDLKQVIKMKPDYAHAYNALGYTLADRTENRKEALALIEKALALKPGEPAIIDSLGWVQYRLGNFDAALAQLRTAFQKQPDPEIAAHLGEVLWVSGKKDEARQVWEQGRKKDGANKVLNETIKRLAS